MNLITAAISAAIIAFIVNGIALKIFKDPAMVLIIPVTEELAKTLSAFYWGAPLLATHFLFGVEEAWYDIRGGERVVIASLLSIVGHSLFGLITHLIISYFDSILWGLAGGTLLHSLWNGIIIKIIGSSNCQYTSAKKHKRTEEMHEGGEAVMPKVRYVCEACQRIIDEVELAEGGVDNLGLNFLTSEGQEDIIEGESREDLFVVASLCEECIDEIIGVESEEKE